MLSVPWNSFKRKVRSTVWYKLKFLFDQLTELFKSNNLSQIIFIYCKLMVGGKDAVFVNVEMMAVSLWLTRLNSES